MRASEIIRATMDLIDGIQLGNKPEQKEPEYTNSPEEKIHPLQSAFPAGNDMHHSKAPSDIRSNSISMYPNYQAKE